MSIGSSCLYYLASFDIIAHSILRVLWGPAYEGAPSVFFGTYCECDGEARLMVDGEEN